MSPSKRNILIAKELKTVIYLFILAIFFGLIAYTYYYYFDFEVNKYDDLKAGMVSSATIGYPWGECKDRNFNVTNNSNAIFLCNYDSLEGESFILFKNHFPFPFSLNDNLHHIIDRRKDYYKQETFDKTKASTLYIVLLMILGRYLILGIIWVFTTSNQE
jgi:hypothetical protein